MQAEEVARKFDRYRREGLPLQGNVTMRRKYTKIETERFAKKMRNRPTATESRLFNAITQALVGTTAKVQMQYVVGPYIADIYIPYASLIIEVDGSSHAGRQEYDSMREEFMKRQGFRTLRFTNAEIWADCASAVKQIILACGELSLSIPGSIPITYCPPRRAAGRSRLRLL